MCATRTPRLSSHQPTRLWSAVLDGCCCGCGCAVALSGVAVAVALRVVVLPVTAVAAATVGFVFRKAVGSWLWFEYFTKVTWERPIRCWYRYQSERFRFPWGEIPWNGILLGVSRQLVSVQDSVECSILPFVSREVIFEVCLVRLDRSLPRGNRPFVHYPDRLGCLLQ